MRSGDVGLLDEIAFPGALRSLHTQVFRCGPDDGNFYCGQAPAGYGGYRADFNSSHAYFENLFLYYWLTGDYTVVETLQRGARSMRNYLCSRRPGSPCLPDDPPSDYWAQLTGRVAMQWFAVFRFVGLASNDASYLEDYSSGLARAVTQHYVEVEQSGTRYGFWLPGGTPVNQPGTYTTDQLWMASLYDMNMLYRLQCDTNDAPIGNPAIPPSQVLAAWGRMLVRFGATVSGDGTANGRWPNQLNFTWSGHRIGGTLISVGANPNGSDPYLYDTGKASLTAVLVRAGQQANNVSLTRMGTDLTQLALASAQGGDGGPLGKIQGEYLARVPAAVARLTAPSPPTVDRDFNGDSKSDILWRHTSGTVALWLLNGTSVSGSGVPGAPTTDWQIMGVGDFNGDGMSDILWRHTSGTVALWLLNGTSVSGSGVPGAPTTDWKIMGIGDFNGDGMADILWQHTSGTVALWLLNGTSILTSGGPGGATTDWQIMGVGDFNGDGMADILWRHTSGTVAMWLLNGTSVIGSGVLGALGTDWTIGGVGDFNGDGMSDVLWRHTSGTVTIWLLNGTSITGSGVAGAPTTDWQIVQK
jgi:hypothetical protein